MNEVGREWVESVEKAGQFAVLVEGEPVPLLSLPAGAVGKIQDRTGLRWMTIILDPLFRIDVAEDLVRAAYAKENKTLPPLNSSADAARLIVEIPSDLPDTVTDNGGGGTNPTTAS